MGTKGGASVVPHLTLVCGYPPNQVFGGGIILRSLLEDYPPERLTVVTSATVLAALRSQDGDAGLLPCLHVPIDPLALGPRGARRIGRALTTTKIVPAAAAIARHAAGGALLAVPWGGLLGSELFAAAYLAHRRTGARLIVYELDEWRASVRGDRAFAGRLLERWFHGRLVRASSATFAVSEQLAGLLERQFARPVEVLSSPVEMPDCAPPRSGAPSGTGTFRVVYTGAVYGAQADAIATVSRAVEALGGDAQLVLHTGDAEEGLRRFAIPGPRTTVRPLVPKAQVAELLAAADVLLLPLSFRPDQRDVVATSLPTKTADYLASGVPILVHAPPYSTVAQLARRHGCAEVVDTPDAGLVADALRTLRDEPERATKLTQAAWQLARDRHHAPLLRRRLFGAVTGAEGIAAAARHP